MSTIDTLKNKTVAELANFIDKGGDHKYLCHVVPLFGTMSSTRTDGDEFCTDLEFQIYLGFEDGLLIEIDWDLDIESMVKQIATALDIEPALLQTYTGERENDSDFATRDPYWDYRTWWNLIYVTPEIFSSLQKMRRFSVVAEHSLERIVAPKPVKNKQATFAFDLNTAKLKFVRIHDNSVEYVTEDGIKVFDNRQRVLGISSGMATVLTGEETMLDGAPIRRDNPMAIIERTHALREFIRSIGSHGDIGQEILEQRPCGKYATELREFAGRALAALGHWDDLLRVNGDIIARGIELLYGDMFVPAPVLFTAGTWHNKIRLNHIKRLVLCDAKPSEGYDRETRMRSLDPRYVVITD